MTFEVAFSQVISSNVTVRVIVTPVNGWSGLYVEDVSGKGFSVKSMMGDPNVEFNWLAIGRRNTYEESPILPIPTH